MTVLRVALGGIGMLLLFAALIRFIDGARPVTIITLASIGAIFTLGAFFERVTYKKLAARKPPPDYVATSERFVDPTTGKLVQVYTKPETGERIYVDLDTASARLKRQK